jgi:hypothetical protein
VPEDRVLKSLYLGRSLPFPLASFEGLPCLQVVQSGGDQMRDETADVVRRGRRSLRSTGRASFKWGRTWFPARARIKAI